MAMVVGDVQSRISSAASESIGRSLAVRFEQHPGSLSVFKYFSGGLQHERTK